MRRLCKSGRDHDGAFEYGDGSNYVVTGTCDPSAMFEFSKLCELGKNSVGKGENELIKTFLRPSLSVRL